jgi:hypothetical protein
VKYSSAWKSMLSVLVSWAVLWGVYLLLVGNASVSELIVGALLAAGVTALFLWSKYLIAFPVRLQWRFLTPTWRLPGATLWETVLIFIALFRRLAGQDVQGALLRVPFWRTGPEPESATWRTIAVFGVCVSPNSYVVRVDLDEKVIIVRQLVGRELSKNDSKFLETG